MTNAWPRAPLLWLYWITDWNSMNEWPLFRMQSNDIHFKKEEKKRVWRHAYQLWIHKMHSLMTQNGWWYRLHWFSFGTIFASKRININICFDRYVSMCVLALLHYCDALLLSIIFINNQRGSTILSFCISILFYSSALSQFFRFSRFT